MTFLNSLSVTYTRSLTPATAYNSRYGQQAQKKSIKLMSSQTRFRWKRNTASMKIENSLHWEHFWANEKKLFRFIWKGHLVYKKSKQALFINHACFLQENPPKLLKIASFLMTYLCEDVNSAIQNEIRLHFSRCTKTAISLHLQAKTNR